MILAFFFLIYLSINSYFFTSFLTYSPTKICFFISFTPFYINIAFDKVYNQTRCAKLKKQVLY